VNGYVLDTHAWIWLVLDDPRLDSQARKALLRGGEQNRLFVAAISVWELALLEAAGRLALARPLGQWVEGALATRGLRLVPLSAEIAVASQQLPGRFHADPADRMIVATARGLGAAVATRDRRIVEYGRLGHLPVLEV
jgi:PIN domain nuclease of toxin-antitoxin system